MNVFKFGGASINSVERIKHLKDLLEATASDDLLIVVSAMGKTTNALEKVALAFYEGRMEESLQLFGVIKNQHVNTAKYLLVTHFNECIGQLADFFTEVEWLLHDQPVRSFGYYYDQIVCLGELLSSCLVSHYLREVGIKNKWLDVRDLIKTDNHFQNADINWELTSAKVNRALTTNKENKNHPKEIFITQGFIGSTDENESTTLGREGSDFSAAIFAHVLNAESVTIWKDVPGVMNADPHQFKAAELLPELSYNEVIEMAYYGAQVIHPKTIKPLQNKQIPLYVKSFLAPDAAGTLIYKKSIKNLPPILIVKEKQALMYLQNPDFSFMSEAQMNKIYKIFSELNITPHLIQMEAIGMTVCLNDHPDRIHNLAAMASGDFELQLEKGLSLLTIRHYTETLLNSMLDQKDILLIQKTKTTVQVVYKE